MSFCNCKPLTPLNAALTLAYVKTNSLTKSCTSRNHRHSYRRSSWCTGLMLLLLVCALLPATLASSSESKEDDSKDNAGPAPGAPLPEDAKGLEERGSDGLSKGADEKGLVDLGFIHAFVASLSVIVVSELGDKTFFIAAIMAMRHSRLTVFAGAIGALALMTILSALLGFATTVIPRWFTYYASSALFAIFGLKMLREGYYMSADEGKEEYEEVQADLRKKEEEAERESKQGMNDVETGHMASTLPAKSLMKRFCSRVLLQSFTLTFLAEWGDRSQISTIILAARDEVLGVIIGGTLGHALCTGLAVLGGRFIAQRISIRTVTLIGGVVFLLFALSAFVLQIEDD